MRLHAVEMSTSPPLVRTWTTQPSNSKPAPTVTRVHRRSSPPRADPSRLQGYRSHKLCRKSRYRPEMIRHLASDRCSTSKDQSVHAVHTTDEPSTKTSCNATAIPSAPTISRTAPTLRPLTTAGAIPRGRAHIHHPIQQKNEVATNAATVSDWLTLRHLANTRSSSWESGITRWLQTETLPRCLPSWPRLLASAGQDSKPPAMWRTCRFRHR
jgi:hypothetical protein